MTADDLLTIALDGAYFAIFAITLVDYLRRPDPMRRAVMAVFGAVALLLAALAVATLVPSVATVAVFVALLALLAVPPLTLLLLRRFRPVSRLLIRASLVVYAILAVFAILLALDLLGPLAFLSPIMSLVALAYFVILESSAAILFWIEARRRAGASGTRLSIAAVATGLFAVAILALGAGGLVVEPDTDASATLGVIVRVLAFLAALGYLAAFMPPRFLRQRSQQGVAYRFVRDLNLVRTGAPIERIWELLATTALTSTGARGAAVAIDAAAGRRSEMPLVVGDWPLDAAGQPQTHAALTTSSGGGPRQLLTVPIASDQGRVGTLSLLVHGRPLFVEDDLELLELLGAAAARAVEREQLIVDLRAANEAKSDFLASMSHELRTPLAAIIGFTELMLAERGDGTELTVPAEWVAHVHNGGDHLLSLINDVLDLAKVEAGRLELQLEPVDLSIAVAESVAGLRPLADRKTQTITAEAPSVVLTVDRGRFRQMLYNLLSNAIKYTGVGGDIRVVVTVTDDAVAVAVSDTGVGIAPEDQVHVFEEFRQVGDPEAREAGTGLGLALTRRLVEAHGGRIELASTPGVGSTFTLILPRVAVPIDDAPPPAWGPGEHPADGDKGEVLVIEDDPSAMRLLRAYLEADGYAVRGVDTGEAGATEARARRPSAIILDLLLPGVDGWEVLRRLKNDPELRDIPVIIVTVVDEREIGLALGAVDYFVKPVDRVALLARLARYTYTTKVRERTVRVLAIDDDPAALELIEGALRPEGFEVVTAPDGRVGIDLARAGVDLVICDLLMPGLDGFGVVAALKAEHATRDIPILILTAHTLTSTEKERLNGDILGVVEKGSGAQLGLHDWLAQVAPVRTAGHGDGTGWRDRGEPGDGGEPGAGANGVHRDRS